MKKFLLFFIFFVFFILSGCGFTPFKQKPIISGVIIWCDEGAIKYYQEPKKTLQKGIKNALKDLNLSIQEETSDLFLVTTPNIITIKLKQVKQFNQIEVTTSLGNRSNIELIFNQIDLNLNSIEYDNQGKSTKRIKLFN